MNHPTLILTRTPPSSTTFPVYPPTQHPTPAYTTFQVLPPSHHPTPPSSTTFAVHSPTHPSTTFAVYSPTHPSTIFPVHPPTHPQHLLLLQLSFSTHPEHLPPSTLLPPPQSHPVHEGGAAIALLLQG